MRRNLIIVILLLICNLLSAQPNTLINYEYWFDTNQASSITKTLTGVSTVTSISETIDVTVLPNGLHSINFRTKDSKGHWSATTSHFFLKAEAFSATSLSAFEYWFDNNQTNGTTKALANGAAEASISEAIDVSVLPNGLHSINFRTKDNKGHWSATASHFFIKEKQKVTDNKIVGYRYWINQDFANHKSVAVDPASPLILSNIGIQLAPNTTPTPNSYEFEPNSTENRHKIYYKSKTQLNIQFKDQADVWSSTKVDTILNQSPAAVRCDTLYSKVPRTKALPQRDTIHFFMVNALAGDSLVFKTDRSLVIDLFDPFGKKLKTITAPESINGQGVHAKLDGAYYALVHGFDASSGSYTITYTHIAKYAMLGHFPRKVGNKGTSLISFEGNGFTPTTKVNLTQNGVAIIVHDTVLCQGLSSLKAAINFDNANIGCYDIEVNFGDTIILIKNGLEVEENKPIELNVSIIGPSVFRRGTSATYTIRVENKGNTTAYGVPLGICLSSSDEGAISSIKINSNAGVDKIPPLNFTNIAPDVADSISNYFNSLDDKDRFLKLYNSNTNIYSLRNEFFISNIDPLNSYEITLTIVASSIIDIQVAVPKIWQSENKRNHINIQRQSSIDGCCMKQGVECIVNLVLMYPQIKKIMDALPIDKQCIVNGVLQIVSFTTGVYCDGTITDNYNKNTGADIKSALYSSMAKCIDIKEFKLFEKLFKAFDFYGDITTIMNCATVATNFATGKCNNDPQKDSLKATPIRSYDPNDKIGFRSPSGSRYFNADKKNFTYIINFENKATATAPAQEVFITDTLNLKTFDINNFRAGYIKIGNKIVQAPYDVQNHTWQVDMRPAMNLITEVKLSLDQTTGVARWYMKAIDPFTGNLPADPLAGFLPPNDSTGSGQGLVSFTINLKDGIEEGEHINNRATIVFDNNEPITTPTWGNIKDNIAPVSTMLQPAIITDTTATITWQAEDNKNGSGVYRYNLFVKKGNEEYKPLLSNTELTAIEFSYVMDTKYSFYVTAADSAGNLETKTNLPDVVLLNTTGVNDINVTSENAMVVYPNPSSENANLTVEFNLPCESLEKSQLIITSASGSVVKTIDRLDNKITISNLGKGVFLFNLQIEQKSITTKKIVVQ